MAITGVVHAGVTKDNKAARQTACLPPPLYIVTTTIHQVNQAGWVQGSRGGWLLTSPGPSIAAARLVAVPPGTRRTQATKRTLLAVACVDSACARRPCNRKLHCNWGPSAPPRL